MITIGSNIASLAAQRRLGQNTDRLQRTFQRLATGLRINRASDDAAGLAIAGVLNVDSRIYAQAVRNGNDGIAMLSIAGGATKELENILTRIQELAEQAANGVYSDRQRGALNLEAQQLVLEYKRITATTGFNGIPLLLDDTEVGLQLGTNSAIESRIQMSFGLISSVAGDGTFQAETTVSTAGAIPRNVLSSDFNGDGHTDIAFTGSGGSGIALGNGDGSFKAEIDIAVGVGTSYSNELKAGDLNGDGKLDLVIPGYYSSAVSVLFGNGDGRFTAPLLLATNPSTWEVELADFNNDGKLDIATMTDAETTRFVFLGNGNGSFNSPIVATAYAYQFAAGDVNRDGNIDLVTAGVAYLGNGDGHFSVGPAFAMAGGGRSAALADFNGDGFLDFAASSPGGSFGVAFGNGDGSFKAGVSYGTGAQSFYDYQLTAGDLTGDGRPEIVIAESGGNSVSVFVNPGDGTFAARVSYLTGSAGNNTALGDFNEDGAVDIVESKAASNYFALLLGNPQQSTDLPPVDLTTRGLALETLENVKSSREFISKKSGEFGAFQNRVSAAISNAMVARESNLAAESQIRDADISVESAQMVRQRILQQATAAVLAQANAQPAIALTVLGQLRN